MTNYLSNKLRVISFMLICMVVLLHAQIIQLSPDGISVFIQELITGKITKIAVSSFYAISGFLFAYSIDEDKKIEVFRNKIKKRVKTLLVPYFIWSTVCTLFLCIAQLLMPSIFGTSKLIMEYDFNDYINEFIINPTIAYQLWFLRDLFIVSILSPVLYILLKYLRGCFIIFLFLLNLIFWKIGFLSIVSVTFFSTGMYLAMFRKNWPEYIVSNRLWWFIPLFWISLNLFLVYVEYDSLILFFINKILGIISIWVAYDLLYEKYIERWLTVDVFSFTFLIFILHEPTLTLLKKLYIKGIGVDSIITSLFFYFFSPLALISGIIFVGRFFKTRRPNTYNLLTGSR